MTALQREDVRRALVVSSAYKPEGQDVARAIVTWLERAGVDVIQDIDGKEDLSVLAKGAVWGEDIIIMGFAPNLVRGQNARAMNIVVCC